MSTKNKKRKRFNQNFDKYTPFFDQTIKKEKENVI